MRLSLLSYPRECCSGAGGAAAAQAPRPAGPRRRLLRLVSPGPRELPRGAWPIGSGSEIDAARFFPAVVSTSFLVASLTWFDMHSQMYDNQR